MPSSLRPLLLFACSLAALPGGACKPSVEPKQIAHAEVKPNLNGIRAAQIAYFSVNKAYVQVVDPVPRAAAALNPQAVDWPKGTAFDSLDWAPVGKVYGTYWVEVGEDGASFVAHALIDADGDGTPAHYTAERGTEAKPITPEGVF
jgi:hypothetical protein